MAISFQPIHANNDPLSGGFEALAQARRDEQARQEMLARNLLAQRSADREELNSAANRDYLSAQQSHLRAQEEATKQLRDQQQSQFRIDAIKKANALLQSRDETERGLGLQMLQEIGAEFVPNEQAPDMQAPMPMGAPQPMPLNPPQPLAGGGPPNDASEFDHNQGYNFDGAPPQSMAPMAPQNPQAPHAMPNTAPAEAPQNIAPPKPQYGETLRYRINGGPLQTILSADAAEALNRQRRAKEAEAFSSEMQSSDSYGKYIKDLKGLIASGAIKSREDAAAHLEKMRATDASIERARLAGQNYGIITPDKAHDNLTQDANSAHNLLNQELNREDYRGQVEDLRDTRKLIDMISSDNVAAQKAALGVWAKQASGPGAVQQSERNEFVNTVGGKSEQVRKWASEWIAGGEVPPRMRAIFGAAARDIIMKRQLENLQGLRENIRSMFANHPNPTMHAYSDWAAERIANQFLPPTPKKSTRPARDALGKPAPPEAAAAPVKSGGVLDEVGGGF